MTENEPQQPTISPAQLLGAEPVTARELYELPKIDIKLCYSELAREIMRAIPRGAMYYMDGHYYTLTDNMIGRRVEKREMTG